MELKHLRNFLVVAREGSITHAANFLHISQPALSRQMQELEEELDVKLFIRGSHQLSLSPDGMSFRARAREVVELADQMLEEFQMRKNNISGEIRIGAGESVHFGLLCQIMKEIQREYPEIHFSIYSGNADDVLEKLEKGILDFGVLIEPVSIHHYDAIPFPQKDRWGVLLPKNHPLASLDGIDQKALQRLPLLVSRQGVPSKMPDSEFMKWFSNPALPLQVVGNYNLIFNAALMVENGLGAALALEGLVSVDEKSPLAFVPLKPELESRLLFIWKKLRILSPAADLFLERVQQVFEKDEESTPARIDGQI